MHRGRFNLQRNPLRKRLREDCPDQHPPMIVARARQTGDRAGGARTLARRLLTPWTQSMMKFESPNLARVNGLGASEMPPSHQKVILLVDDDNEIVESMRTVL